MQKDAMLKWDSLLVRVERGAARLDVMVPGWAHRVDLGTLDMGNMFRCVLGQLFVSYTEGLDEMFPDALDADVLYFLGKWHGFSLPQHERREIAERLGLPRWTNGVVFEDLTAVWVPLVTARQEEAEIVIMA